MARGMRDLCSPTTDRTCGPSCGVLITGPPGKSLMQFSFRRSFPVPGSHAHLVSSSLGHFLRVLALELGFIQCFLRSWWEFRVWGENPTEGMPSSPHNVQWWGTFTHRDASHHWRWALLGFPLPSFPPSLYLCVYWLSCAAWAVSVPWPGTEPGPGQWKCRAITTRSPGNSLNILPFEMNNYLRGDAWRLCKCPVCP